MQRLFCIDVLLILCQLTEEPELSSSGTPEMHPAPHQSEGGFVCGGFSGDHSQSTATVACGMCISRHDMRAQNVYHAAKIARSLRVGISSGVIYEEDVSELLGAARR